MKNKHLQVTLDKKQAMRSCPFFLRIKNILINSIFSSFLEQGTLAKLKDFPGPGKFFP